MSRALDLALVGLAVLAAMAYAVHALAPRAWRNRLYRRFGLKVGADGAGCGGCGDCAASGKKEKSPEVSVPVKSILRRK